MTRSHVHSHAVLAAAVLSVFMAGCDRNAQAPAAATPPSESPAATAPTTPPPATSAIANMAGEGIAGQLTLTGDAGAVHVAGQLTGLPADSEHGFHVHDTGDCSDFVNGSAGNHFNPDEQPHGGPETPAHHAGDLANQRSDATGTIAVDAHIAGVGLATRDERDLLGRALIVHAGLDDYSTQPSGGSGEPIACGVIEMPAEAPAAP